jgi:hypothetical protein
MIKKIALICLVSAYLFLPAFSASALSARSIRYGLDEAATGGGLSKGEGAKPSDSLAIESGKIVGTLLAFLGVIFLVLMIGGGIMWMTAGGNDSRVATARRLIVSAIIGLIIVISSYAITTFIADNLLSTSTGGIYKSDTATGNTTGGTALGNPPDSLTTPGCCVIKTVPITCQNVNAEKTCTETYEQGVATFYKGIDCSQRAECK